MNFPFASLFRCVASLSLGLALSLGAAISLGATIASAAPPFDLATQLVREGGPEGVRWTIPRVAAIGVEQARPELLMTLSKVGKTGTDVYRGLAFMTSHDAGETWSPLVD